ncbi:hypothetical protein FQN54_000072 [Arachnomyces sp. PD_36]|nr:hypothetical protein FQN54_000072 [Arachnomyces sp. PD_36]
MALGAESHRHIHLALRRRWVLSTRQQGVYKRPQRRYNSSSSSSEHKPSSPPTPSKQSTTPPNPTTPTPTTPKTARSIREIITSGPLGRAADVYSRTQARRPWATQMVCTAVIYLFGDLSAQLVFGDEGGDKEKEEMEEDKEGEKKGGYDPLRTMRHLSIGIVASVPSYTWFMYVHNNFNFPSKILSILTKVLVQQITFTPIFNIYFFSAQSLLAGSSPTDTLERLKKAVPTSVLNSFKLWPAVSAFSFVYVKAEFRPLFFGAVAVGWQTYLSWLNQNAAREVRAEEARAERGVGVEPVVATTKGGRMESC